MTIYHTISSLQDDLRKVRNSSKVIVFVPTMGALHNGHVSLVKEAQKNGDFVVCSIFVNPTQFNEESDLKNYPRTPEEDLNLLESNGCDAVFMPEVSDIYPKDYVGLENVDFGELTSTIEALKRPGHFDGVINVVKRLFEIVLPDKACFGLKDFQQISIIRRMVREFQMDIEIIGCPIIREKTGLAMSSRNELLSKKDRKLAAQLSKMLFYLEKEADTHTISQLRELGKRFLRKFDEIDVEYLEFVDADSFKAMSDKAVCKNTVILLAAWIGGVRLIDNIFLEGRNP